MGDGKFQHEPPRRARQRFGMGQHGKRAISSPRVVLQERLNDVVPVSIAGNGDGVCDDLVKERFGVRRRDVLDDSLGHAAAVPISAEQRRARTLRLLLSARVVRNVLLGTRGCTGR